MFNNAQVENEKQAQSKAIEQKLCKFPKPLLKDLNT